jgi:hypothetical protein
VAVSTSSPPGGPNVGVDRGGQRRQWRPRGGGGGGGGRRVLMSQTCDMSAFQPQLLDLATCRR